MIEFEVHREDVFGNEVTITVKFRDPKRARLLLARAQATMAQNLHAEDNYDE